MAFDDEEQVADGLKAQVLQEMGRCLEHSGKLEEPIQKATEALTQAGRHKEKQLEMLKVHRENLLKLIKEHMDQAEVDLTNAYGAKHDEYETIIDRLRAAQEKNQTGEKIGAKALNSPTEYGLKQALKEIQTHQQPPPKDPLPVEVTLQFWVPDDAKIKEIKEILGQLVGRVTTAAKPQPAPAKFTPAHVKPEPTPAKSDTAASKVLGQLIGLAATAAVPTIRHQVEAVTSVSAQEMSPSPGTSLRNTLMGIPVLPLMKTLIRDIKDFTD